MDKNNYKVFYWAPDYSFCGFATSDQVQSTAKKWMKDKRLKMTERMDRGDKTEDLVNNVSHIPEIMKLLHHTNLD